MRERDKKSYPQFSNRIIEWKNEGWNEGKICLVRVVAVDYNIGATLVNVDDPKDFFTCLNGPLSPEGRHDLEDPIKLDRYDKGFEYLLSVLRSNGVYDVQAKNKLTGAIGWGFGMNSCAFS